MLIVCCCLFFVPGTRAQRWGDSTRKNRVFYSVEEAPKFPGGMAGYYKFLSDSLKMPEKKFAMTSNRMVMVRVVIDTAGVIVYAEIEKGVNADYNRAALDAVKAMPAWTPARQNHFVVPVTIALPMLFVD